MFCHSLDIGAVINVQKYGRRNRILEAFVMEKISLKETDGPALFLFFSGKAEDHPRVEIFFSFTIFILFYFLIGYIVYI